MTNTKIKNSCERVQISSHGNSTVGKHSLASRIRKGGNDAVAAPSGASRRKHESVWAAHVWS